MVTDKQTNNKHKQTKTLSLFTVSLPALASTNVITNYRYEGLIKADLVKSLVRSAMTERSNDKPFDVTKI